MTQIPARPATAADDRLSALLDAAVDGIVLINPNGEVTRFNSAAERLFGYAASEVVGRNVNILMPQPYHREHDGYLHRYLSTGERRIIGIGREVVAQRKDGSTFPIDLSVGEFRRGNEHGFVGILRDISERKTAEELMRRSTEELRLMFDNAPTAITITGPDGHIVNANRAVCNLLACLPDDLRGVRHSDLMHEEDRPGAIAKMRKLQEGGDSCSCEVRYRRRDGTFVHTMLYTAVARDGAGRPLMMISEIIDRSAFYEITREAEDLRSRLTHVARLGTLGEMVSGIAHEVNQPLTAIANYASACRRMLTTGQAQPADLVETLEKISAQAERAGQVIRGLRALLRKRDQVREAVDCNQLVREVSKLTDFELRQSGFRLQHDLAPDLPPVIGDGIQIQQVVLNLIRNAFDAMAERAHCDFVQVSTCAADGTVEIRVADCGPGIPAEVRERLFEPFFTTKSQGIGLGLSICKSIVSAHGGEMVHSPNERGGTTFRIRLPSGA